MWGFLLHNLIGEDGRLTWRINLAALATNMPALIGYPEDLGGRTYAGPAHFIAGAASDYVGEAGHARIRELFPMAEILSIPDAGHWVIYEAPDVFNDTLLEMLGVTPA